MSQKPRHNLCVVILTFLLALILTVLPLTNTLEFYRPNWVALVLIYWCMALPTRIGLFSAAGLGLVVDALHGSLLGQHALSLSVVALITLSMYRRVRVYPLWQQAVVVLFILLIERILNYWILGIIGQLPNSLSYWWPPLISMLLWPWLFIALRDIRRRHKVS